MVGKNCKSENNNDEWFTPLFVIAKVKKVFGGRIDLDPCSCEAANERIGALTYFDKEANCLIREWHGQIFMNPPYSGGKLSKVLSHAIAEFDAGRITEMIILTNSGTDTKWNRIINSGVQGYTFGRLNFIYPDGTMAGKPSRGQCFTYFGKNYKLFRNIFEEDNFCFFPNKRFIGETHANVG